MNYYDISPLLCEKIAVFPGDQAFSRTVTRDFQNQDPLLLSSVTHTLHLGAHADATNHYHPEGQGVEQRALSPYLGRCQVIEVHSSASERLQVQDLKSKTLVAPRVLFKTLSFPDPYQWQDQFNSLSPELIWHLHQKGVKLVGIDTPSVDPHDSKKLESHQALYETGMAVLEGVWLADVPEGVYTLIALPLRYEKADASPVRAVLFEGETHFFENLGDSKSYKGPLK